jgi:hypothetical protein
MNPLIELSEPAQARIRARESEAQEQADIARRALKDDLVQAIGTGEETPASLRRPRRRWEVGTANLIGVTLYVHADVPSTRINAQSRVDHLRSGASPDQHGRSPRS